MTVANLMEEMDLNRLNGEGFL